MRVWFIERKRRREPLPGGQAFALIRDKARAARDGINPHRSLKSLRYVVIDTETTGVKPGRGDEIISIAAVPIEGGVTSTDRFDTLVNPYRPIPEEVVRLTGITDEAVAAAPSLFSVLPAFLDFIAGSVLVGHGLGFDLTFLNLKLKDHCNTLLMNPTLDTLAISRAMEPLNHDHSLDALLERHRIPPENRHTALGDCLLTARLFLEQLQLLETKKITTLAELNAYLRLRWWV